MPLGFAQRARSGAGDREVTPRPSTTNGQRIAMARLEQTLVFESLQSRVYGADGVVAPRSRSEIAPDGEAVRFLPEAGNRKQGCKFECPESSRHYS